MILSSVTVCLVPEARKGPFVYHGDLAAACAASAALGFDAIEIFAPSGDHVDPSHLAALLESHSLRLAAVGTGAGMLLHGHSLSDSSESARERACGFVKSIIDFGAGFGAPAIIGSMQGRSAPEFGKRAALDALASSLRELAGYADSLSQELLFEPLNRYETDLINTLSEGMRLLNEVGATNLKLLADLFHMNIEESSIAGSIIDAAGTIGHVHFVDTNRHAAGLGHMAYGEIADALAQSGYSGFASAEAFPLPSAHEAATMTIQSYLRFLGG